MIFSSHIRSLYQSALIALIGLACVPVAASAALLQPSCSLIVVTAHGLTEIKKDGTISLEEGDILGIAWIGTNVETSTKGGRDIEPIGLTVMTAKETEIHEFVFSSGSKKVSCTVTIQVADVKIDTAKLSTSSATPAISGTASGTDTLYVEVLDSTKRSVYTSKAISVKKGNWSTKITKKLKDGTYTLAIRAEKSKGAEVLASETLTIGKSSTKKSGRSGSTVFVEAIPLLIGGQLKTGATVPVSYLQLINLGKDPLTVKGFTVQQHGSASTDVIASLTVIDDAGRVIGSGQKGDVAFKNNKATVSADLTLAGGESRLVTIKVQATNDLMRHIGTQLKLDVTGVETNGSVSGSFPVRGTTWTIGL